MPASVPAPASAPARASLAAGGDATTGAASGPAMAGVRTALERALALGRGVAGTTAPNPPVGCVLLRDGEIVGEGATAPAGGPHAEVRALAAAGARARGAMAVVTLEPCAHTGRTGACTDALLAAGVTDVVHLVADPNPAAAGGAAVLRRAGVAVTDAAALHPDLAAAATHDLRGFLALVAHGRPHVTLKLAQDRTGATVPPAGGYLTGAAARRHVHALRAEVDAVLVGGATVRADDPRLDVRDVAAARQPRAVVLTTGGDLPTSARLLARRPLVIVGPGTPADRIATLSAAGAEVVRVDGDADGPGLAAALAALPDLGILSVLAEPGPRLAAALLAADLVDAAELHVAGTSVAPARTAVALPGPHLRPAGSERVEGDLILRFARAAVG